MDDREQLYQALRNADAAGDTAGAQRLASYIQSLPPAGAAPAKQDAPGTLASIGAGLGAGFGKIALRGQRLLGQMAAATGDPTTSLSSVTGGSAPSMLERAGKALVNAIPGVPGLELRALKAIGADQWLQQNANDGLAKLDAENMPYQQAHPIANSIGKTGSEIVATLPVGGVVGGGIRTLASLPKLAKMAPQIQRLATAVESSGLRTGAPLVSGASMGARAADLGIRAAGGGITGGASAAIATPDHIQRGAIFGAALPPALIGTAKALRYTGNAAKSFVQPFTEAGQDAIAGKIISKFGAGGPMEINAAELVPGSVPTLAEATGNPGIAGLQRVIRDSHPLATNTFSRREAENAAARSAAFDNIAGDQAALEAATSARQEATQPLYNRAFAADAMRRDIANSEQQMRAPFSGVGLSGARDDLATPGLRALMARPGFKSAADSAKRLAADNGVKLDDPLQSLEGLHYIKLALDDALNPTAQSAMGKNASRAIMDMRDRLENELANVAPLYGNARQTYADMSQPINAMEALQNLKLTDKVENMTLAKVKNGIQNLDRFRKAPGTNPAKSITDEQMSGLRSIHDDLRRQEYLNAGSPVKSNTFQNLATDNILSSVLPGRIGEWTRGKVGTSLGQIGKLAYSGPNEAIRNRLTDMMLTPELARAALARQRVIAGQSALERFLQLPAVEQSAVRIAPVASPDRP